MTAGAPGWTVAICSNGRTPLLSTTIAALRELRRDDLEVIVVLGPDTPSSDADTGLPADVRLLRTTERNLSVARNLAIRAARGALIAFLDDDAVPEAWWLDELDGAFADRHDVGGAGGPVFDHTGCGIQVRFTVVSRTGIPRPIFSEIDVASLYSSPDSWEVAAPLGTNSAFRRDALIGVGGFDENFAYFLDESEVSLRLVDSGWAIAQAPGAWVHHKSMPSNTRNAARVVTDWSQILRSASYFAWRHGPCEGRIVEDLGVFIRDARTNVEANIASFDLPPRARDDFARVLEQTVEEGRLAAIAAPRTHHSSWFRSGAGVEDLGPFQSAGPRPQSRRVYVFVEPSPSDAPVMTQVQHAGHVVRSLSRTLGQSTVELESGRWIHRLDARLAGEAAMRAEVARIIEFAPPGTVDVHWSSPGNDVPGPGRALTPR